jgi:hypothetical protein
VRCLDRIYQTIRFIREDVYEKEAVGTCEDGVIVVLFSVVSLFFRRDALMKMKVAIVFCITALAVVACASQALAVNSLGNASFETPILDVTQPGGGSFPFLGDWSAFAPANAGFGNNAAMPRTGVLSGELWLTTGNNFSVIWQDVPVVPGDIWTYAGYHMTPSSPFDAGIEWRIEWKRADESEVSRTENFTAALTGAYTQFSSTVTVPAQAVYGRAVYAIQSFSTNPLGNGIVWVDDFSFVQVPEPASLMLAGLAGIGLVGLRRYRVA